MFKREVILSRPVNLSIVRDNRCTTTIEAEIARIERDWPDGRCPPEVAVQHARMYQELHRRERAQVFNYVAPAIGLCAPRRAA